MITENLANIAGEALRPDGVRYAGGDRSDEDADARILASGPAELPWGFLEINAVGTWGGFDPNPDINTVPFRAVIANAALRRPQQFVKMRCGRSVTR